MHATSSPPQAPVSRRPRMPMVFAAAFVAGAAAAVGVNGVLDVWRAQARPVVESEPIFVALRSLQQGSPVTVWDVGLRNWPKAMLPGDAIRTQDSFEGCILRHPLREGQPLLSVQLVRPEGVAGATSAADPFAPGGMAVGNQVVSTPPAAEADLWAPAGQPAAPPRPEPAPAPRVTQRQPTSTDVSTFTPESVVATAPADGGRVTPPADVPPTDNSTPVVVQPLPVAPTTGEAVAIEPTAIEPTAIEPRDGDTAPIEPAPVQPVANEPTPADAVDVAVTPPVEPELVSVMRPTPDQTPTTATPAVNGATQPQPEEPRTKGPDGFVRYLVVPERIAREADTFFAVPATDATRQPALTTLPPVAPGANAGPATSPLPEATLLPPVAQQPLSSPPVAESQPMPPDTVTSVPTEPREQPAPVVRPGPPQTAGRTPSNARPAETAQPTQPARRPVANRPKPAPARQSQAPARQPVAPARRGSVDATRQGQKQPPATPEKPTRFGAVLSSITSGFGALAGDRNQDRNPRQAPRAYDYDEAVATDDPALLQAPAPTPLPATRAPLP